MGGWMSSVTGGRIKTRLVARLVRFLHGEVRGFSSALGSIGSAFSGNIVGTAEKTLADRDIEHEIRKEQEIAYMGEAEAGRRLSKMGITPLANATSLATYSEIISGIGAAGSGMAAQRTYDEGYQKVNDYMKGSEGQSLSSINKTAGYGADIKMASAESVSFQDGEVEAASINHSAQLRDDRGFDTDAIGKGMADQQYAKDMGTQMIGNTPGAVDDLIANSQNQSLASLKGGQGLIDSKAFNKDGMLANNKKAADLAKSYVAEFGKLLLIGRANILKAITDLMDDAKLNFCVGKY